VSRLLDAVLKAPPRVLVVTAPAGYGKSTFVHRYGEAFERCAVCDCAGAQDSGELGRRIVDALTADDRSRALDVARSRLARGSDARAQAEILDTFWSQAAPPMLFALDNADALRGIAGAHDVLARLVAVAPGNRVVVLCARRALPAALARAVGNRGVVHADADDLALGEHEVVALALEHGLPANVAEHIAGLAGGWPMVVRLLIDIAAAGHLNDLATRLDDVAFDELYDFLADRVLTALPETVAAAVVVAAALPDARADEVRAILGAQFDALAERRLATLPFVDAGASGRYAVHPLVRATIASRFPDAARAALERAVTNAERAGQARRAAQNALALGDVRRAARALEALPTFMRSADALPDAEAIVARLDGEQIAGYPNLWIATIPFRRFTVDLRTYLREARRVYYCLQADSDARLRTDALLHLASALYQDGLFEECETVVDDALATFAHDPTTERATLLEFVAMLRGLQGRFSEARALRADAAAIRRPDFLADLSLQYVDAHEAFARGRYEAGMAVIDESLRRMRDANLPLYVAFTATNGAIFAWANGDDERFAGHVAQVEAAMIPGIERGFASLLAAARGRSFVPDERFEAPVALAMAFLFRMGFADDRESAAAFADQAAQWAARCRDPYLEVLAHAACVVLRPERRAAEGAALRAAAERVEAPELLDAANTLASGGRCAGVLEPFVRTRVANDRRAEPASVTVSVFGGVVSVRGRDVALAGKELELLTFLAVARPRATVSRAQLLEAVWPDIDTDEDAANNLRVTLSRLRRKLRDESLIVRSDGGFRLSPAVRVDVHELDALVHDTPAGDVVNAERRDALESAFNGAATGVPARFDRFAWFAPHRLRLRDLTLAAGMLLARDALARRAPERALRYARALVVLDPLDEDARRLVLSAYAATGEWSAARRELDGYAALLRTELDAEPSAELVDLVEAARERHRAGTSEPRGGRTPAGVPGTARHA
jgi:DNA-binding SARP family transcriptional activator